MFKARTTKKKWQNGYTCLSPVVSDADYEFQKTLNLPTFEIAGMTLLKRINLIARNGVFEAVRYPVFPSDSDSD